MQKSRWRHLLAAVLIGLVAQIVKTDLPIHCIKAQIEGEWQFYLSQSVAPNSFQEASCGYTLPSTVQDAQLHKPNEQFIASRSIRLRFDIFNQAYSHGRRVGTWTMVYDEGLWIEIEQGSFFVFFEYEKKEGASISTCSRTLIGWYRDQNHRFGCFYGHQLTSTNKIGTISIGEQTLGINSIHVPNSKIVSLAKLMSKFPTDQEMFQSIMKAKSHYYNQKTTHHFLSLAETESSTESETDSENESEDSMGMGASEEITPASIKPNPAPANAALPPKPIQVQHPKAKPAKVIHLNPIVAKPVPVQHKLATKPSIKPTNPTKATKPVPNIIKPKKPLNKIAKKATKLLPKPIKVPSKLKNSKKTGLLKRKPAPKGLVSRKGRLLHLKKPIPGKKKLMRKAKTEKGPQKLKLRKGEVLPWEDPKLKVKEPEYHVRRFWMDMNMHWVTKKGTDKSLAQTGYQVLQEASHADVLVATINKAGLGWKAAKYAFLQGKSLQEVNKWSGRPKSPNKLSMSDSDPRSNQKIPESVVSVAKSDISELPKELDLSKFLSAPRMQNNCGNCYLIATIGMLESRLRMKQGRNIPLSIQYLNDCNFYSQGCNGGFAVQVLRFVRDFWVPPEHCKPFLSTQGTCTTGCTFGRPKEVVTVDQVYYVGGYFGKTTEQLLMRELMDNGPLVISIEPPETFAYYKSGIYRPVSPLVSQIFGTETQWTKVDHSESLVWLPTFTLCDWLAVTQVEQEQ